MRERKVGDASDFGEGYILGQPADHIFASAMQNGGRKSAALEDPDGNRDVRKGPDNVQRQKCDRRFGVEQALPPFTLAFLIDCPGKSPGEGMVVIPGLDDFDTAQMLELRDAENVMRLEFHDQEFIVGFLYDAELHAGFGQGNEPITRSVPIGPELPSRLRVRLGATAVPREVQLERVRTSAVPETETIACVAAMPPSKVISLDRTTLPLTSDQIVSRCPGALNIGTGGAESLLRSGWSGGSAVGDMDRLQKFYPDVTDEIDGGRSARSRARQFGAKLR